MWKLWYNSNRNIYDPAIFISQLQFPHNLFHFLWCHIVRLTKLKWSFSSNMYRNLSINGVDWQRICCGLMQWACLYEDVTSFTWLKGIQLQLKAKMTIMERVRIITGKTEVILLQIDLALSFQTCQTLYVHVNTNAFALELCHNFYMNKKKMQLNAKNWKLSVCPN